jgi:predicted amidohydrolase YtcJ
MKYGKGSFTGKGIALAALLCGLAAGPAAAAPDFIVHNAKVVTVDPSFSIAQAFAVEDGRFLAVGTDEQVLALAGPETRRIDMHGQTVLPGFNETHQSLIGKARTFAISANLTDIHSIADIQNAIREKARTTPAGDWIIGTRGWWEYDLSDGRLPTRADLDAAAPDHPVAIPGPHYWIANSRALALAGITRDTPNPQGGEIVHDANGEPTGQLFDRAGRLVTRLHPDATREQQMAGIRQLLAVHARNGLTSMGETGGSPEGAAMLRELYDHGELTIRVDFHYSIDPTLPLADAEREIVALGPPGQRFGDGMFRSDVISETSLDGAELTAYLREDYPNRPGYRGLQVVRDDQFRDFALLAARYGWRLRPHAVGDAAIDQALTAFEYVNQRIPITERRWAVDHAFLLRPDQYPRIRALGMTVNSQYMHNYQLGALILRSWGRPLADQSERYRDWIANGIRFANGSDGPVSYHAEPLLEIYGSVTRNTGWGGQLGPDQGISRADAIRSATINGAYTTFEEHVKGSIEPGKYADFVVLSADILTVPEPEMRDIRVRTTVLGGRPVFGTLE